MTLPVFWCAEVATAEGVQPLAACQPLTLVGVGEAEGHHMAAVRRLEVGEAVHLVDGCGWRALAVVAEVAKPAKTANPAKTGGKAGVGKPLIWLKLLEISRDPQPVPEVTLVQALSKGGRDELAIETATELGVSQVVAWEADRSIVRWNPTKTEKQLERWQKILYASAKQARRSWMPQMLGKKTTRELVEWVGEATRVGQVVLLCHEEATAPLTVTLRELEPLPPLALIVGPEGGISETETSDLIHAGARAVSLGELVLRASTAGVAALSVIASVAGRM